MKNALSASISVLCLLAAPALASDNELQDLNKTIFESIDLNGNNNISEREVEQFHRSVMYSMDYDDNGSIDLTEFMGWDLGWDTLAASRGLTAEYTTARETAFQNWDANGDGNLSPEEQSVGEAKKAFGIADTSFQQMDFDNFGNTMPLVVMLNEVFSDN